MINTYKLFTFSYKLTVIITRKCLLVFFPLKRDTNCHFWHIFCSITHTVLMMENAHSHKHNRIMALTYQYIFYFFLGSIGGWLWEVLLYYIMEGHFRNRGFFYGPWLPVYGCGAVFFYALLHRFEKRRIFVFVVSLVTGSCLELLAGWLLDHFWEKRYWDYSGLPLNLHGYICLFSALAFGVAGLIWVCWLSELTWRFFTRHKETPALWQRIFLWLLVLAFIIDLICALCFPNTGHGVTS